MEEVKGGRHWAGEAPSERAAAGSAHAGAAANAAASPSGVASRQFGPRREPRKTGSEPAPAADGARVRRFPPEPRAGTARPAWCSPPTLGQPSGTQQTCLVLSLSRGRSGSNR